MDDPLEEAIRELASDLFISSHRHPFPDNEGGYAEALEWARRIEKDLSDAKREGERK